MSEPLFILGCIYSLCQYAHISERTELISVVGAPSLEKKICFVLTFTMEKNKSVCSDLKADDEAD